jgi:phosphatidylglycerol:prolipoprotein diacylglycerol transferase
MDWSKLNAYGILMLLGIVVTAAIWGRINPKRDGRLTIIYFCGLFGALIGAKISFFIAEGWHYRHDWLALVSGRSITGGLLGGYIAVEIGKKALRYPRTTGDAFAIIVPIGLMLGRIGCLLQGCCPGIECAGHWWTITDRAGVERWPAAMVELIFNAIFLMWALAAARFRWQAGNRFHIYLIAYGLFRFFHEFLRADQPVVGRFTGYHAIALAIVIFGMWRYVQRRGEMRAEARPTSSCSVATSE